MQNNVSFGPNISSGKMAVTSLHVGRLRVHISTPGASWIANRRLRIYWFRINSPARRNISTNELTWLRTRWIVTISLFKPSIILHCIFTCAYVSLSKTYSWAEVAVLDSSCSNELVFELVSFGNETCTRLLERLPVVRQSEHFPRAMLW